jgi:hypothetical protein
MAPHGDGSAVGDGGGGDPLRNFPAFPFQPYGIQLDLMRGLYDVLQRGGIGSGLHSLPFPLNLSLLCPFPLNSSSLCRADNPN